MARTDESTDFMPDYLAIGHVTRDITPAGYQVGGTVSFATRAAQAYGRCAAAITSAAPQYDVAVTLPGIALLTVPAAETTTFENLDTPDGRMQTLRGRAAPLRIEVVPARWTQARVVHLAPVADEVDPEFVHVFSGGFIGVTPQGWMRQWDARGRVTARSLRQAEAVLPHVDAVVLSDEDLPSAAELDRLRRLAKVLVVTRGRRGCTVYQADGAVDVAAPVVDQVNATGAGDVFAALFFLQMQRCGDPVASAETAARFAARSVTGATLDDKAHLIRTMAQAEPAHQRAAPCV